jgi:sugar O-acyltransferase (sialic acid O-acetyltransferase NeuD family)
VRTPLLLVAASGLAREAAAAALAGERYQPVGFLDDDPALHGQQLDGLPVLGGLDRLADWPQAQVLLCAGRGTGRAALAGRLAEAIHRTAGYATLLHPTVSVGSNCLLGPGCILLAGCVLTASVTLGSHVVAMPNVVLTHDDVVEDCATLTAGVALAGQVRIGERAYLGTNSAVRERCTVGADAVVGMGAAVICDVPAGQTYVGVPARPLVRAIDSAVAAGVARGGH